jgi:phosphoglucosamine mutase
LKAKLFGSSGIRGLANVDLTPFLAAKIALAAAGVSKARKAVVARDTRVSGLMLEDSVVSGFLAAGVDVSCLGVLPTPVLAFLTRELGADVGVMITASHNPPEYNGVKIFDGEGLAYSEKNQERIEAMIEKESFSLADWRKIGNAMPTDKTRLYVEMIEKAVSLHKRWHVVVDPGCGATSSLAPAIFAALGCRTTMVNAQPDGFFPGRSPEPNENSLKPLANIVKKLHADLGVAYDGDGDRVSFIDRKGKFADFDRILAAYAAHIVKREGGGTVATNVEASMCVEKMVEAHGGKVVRTRVGDIYVSEAIKQSNGVFGGEPCGAWIHPRFHYCPDGILSSVLLLKALEEEDKNLSEFMAETPQYSVARKNINCKNETKHKLVKKAGKESKVFFPNSKNLSTVDGVRLAVENGWLLIRASGTEPLIRLTAEGESLKAAQEIAKKGAVVVNKLIAELER